MNRLSFDKRVLITACALEHMGVNATARTAGVSENAVSRNLLWLGEACARFHDAADRHLPSERLELDELTSILHGRETKIQPHLRGSAEHGEMWTWLGFDPDSKFMVSWHIGKQTPADCETFCHDVRARVATPVPQISTDGLLHYRVGLHKAFGEELSYATIIKVRGASDWLRESPEQQPVEGMRKGVVVGAPDEDSISTSGIERANLTLRMQSSRYQKMSYYISQSIRHHRAALGLFWTFYNYCRYHDALRCTPAMQLGVTDRLWDIEDFVRLMDSDGGPMMAVIRSAASRRDLVVQQPPTGNVPAV